MTIAVVFINLLDFFVAYGNSPLSSKDVMISEPEGICGKSVLCTKIAKNALHERGAFLERIEKNMHSIQVAKVIDTYRPEQKD